MIQCRFYIKTIRPQCDTVNGLSEKKGTSPDLKLKTVSFDVQCSMLDVGCSMLILITKSRKGETTKICSKHFVLFKFRVFVIVFLIV